MTTVLTGDCREVLRGLDANSVDACVCDPPYALTANKKGGSGAASVDLSTPYGRTRITVGNGAGGFMGKAWDSEIPDAALWAEVLRVVKPGAHLLAFGGTRTFHRLMCAIEDAGWEIRDTLMFLYGSGFPKSLDVSKAIDKRAGVQRERVRGVRSGVVGDTYAQDAWSREYKDSVLSSQPITDAAKEWAGWGTALKPAYEPIVLARKPLVGTVAANVLQHGTGGLNIDACRITVDEDDANHRHNPSHGNDGADSMFGVGGHNGNLSTSGRWPANIVLDEASAGMLDAETDELQAAKGAYVRRTGATQFLGTMGDSRVDTPNGISDIGGASRFFYTAKASRAERERGLEGFATRNIAMAASAQAAERRGEERNGKGDIGFNDVRRVRNHHPTVKPVDLMRWLVRLVTPPNGLVLDPFTGSGTTGVAAVLEERRFIGIEREPEYVEIAQRRINRAAEQGSLFRDIDVA